MAKQWFTTLPDAYYMKNLARGGRNEFIFAFVGMTFLHFTLFKDLKAKASSFRVDQNDFQRTKSVDGKNFTVQN